MKIYFPLILGIALVAACAPASNLHPDAGPATTPAVYWHQQQNIQFTQVVRDKQTRQFLVLINRYRKEKGLRALAADAVLQATAQWMSDNMAQYDYTGHTDSLGRNPFKRMADLGYSLDTYKGENVAAGQESAEKVFAAWRKSPLHNANMLNANFKVIGIGLSYNRATEYGWFWTTNFGGEKSR